MRECKLSRKRFLLKRLSVMEDTFDENGDKIDANFKYNFHEIASLGNRIRTLEKGDTIISYQIK